MPPPGAALTTLRLALHRNGYTPVPVSDPNPKLVAGGKAPLFPRWRDIATSADAGTIATWPTTIRNHGNTGLLTGDLIGLDLDIPVQALADQVADLVDTMLPATPLHRIGKAPKSLRCYRAETPLPKLETPELILPCGEKVQVEALGAGQQFVAYGTHPGTGRPYKWPREAPEDLALDELPILPEATLRAFLAEAEALLRAAGGRTEAEIKRDAEPEPPDEGDTVTVPPSEGIAATVIPSATTAKPKGRGEFFKAVNKAALGNIGLWLCAIFPKASEEAGTGAWRVASADIGRPLEEDLSVHPTLGGHDFGTRNSCSPIDVVIEHGGAADAQAAALWLCDKLGKAPGDLGWKAAGAKPSSSAPDAPFTWPAPLDFLATETRPPPVLDESHIPAALFGFVVDTAERMGVDPAAVALSCLVACASVVTDDWRVQPKRFDPTWTESPRLWGAIVGDPSILKSPVIAACTRPIDKIEAEARRRHAEAMRLYRQRVKEAKADKTGATPEPMHPRCDRYLIEGATVEAISETLRDDDEARHRAPAGKVLSRHDEMSEFFGNLDRYKSGGRGGGDRGAYLRLFNGGPYTVDRVMRGSFTVPNWSACFLGGIQPGPIQRIARDAADDGLLQRFLYVVPGGQRPGVDRAPDRAAQDRYTNLIPALSVLVPPCTPDGHHTQIVTLHADAHPYREGIEALARAMAALPDVSPRLRSAFGKWPGLFARVALTFHLIDIADARAREVPAPMTTLLPAVTAERAAAFMREMVLPHLLRAEGVMFATVQTGHAGWIAGHILAQRMETITTRDVMRAYGALRPPEMRVDLEATMASLVAMGWLEPEPPANPVKPVSTWKVNPAVHVAFERQGEAERSQRAQSRADLAAMWEALRERKQA